VLKQNYNTRGQLAFAEDQLRAAVDLFKDGDMKNATEVLRSVANFISQMLGDPPPVKQ